MSTEELRALFPEITDEEIATRQNAAAAKAQADADKESQRQSLRDQIANLQGQLDAIDAPTEG